MPSISRADSLVTTYITTVQKERDSIRWTLTEWLRIKERMRLMDLWLAMFSNPKNAAFRPELNLGYSVTNATLDYSGGGASSLQTRGTQARSQLWLTNLVSASTGLRMINIDFGVEGFHSETKVSPDMLAASSTSDINENSSSSAIDTTDSESAGKFRRQYGTANFRLFGKNIQDTSLVLKIGKYQTRNTLIPEVESTSFKTYYGILAGAELQLYITKFLGLEGNYLQYGNSRTAGNNSEILGAYYDYQAFVEVAIFRLMVGQYVEDWEFGGIDESLTSSERGFYTGLKIQL